MDLDPLRRSELVRILSGLPGDYSDPYMAFDPALMHLAAGKRQPQDFYGYGVQSEQPRFDPSPHRASPFAPPGMPRPDASPARPGDGQPALGPDELLGVMREFGPAVPAVGPFWENAISQDEMRTQLQRSYPAIAPLFERWLSEVTDLSTYWNTKQGMSESEARRAAEQEWRNEGENASPWGYGMDPDWENIPEAWGGPPESDPEASHATVERNGRVIRNPTPWKGPKRGSRAMQFMEMSELLKRLLEKQPEEITDEDLKAVQRFLGSTREPVQERNYNPRRKRKGVPTSELPFGDASAQVLGEEDLNAWLREIFRKRAA
jgi:hypothetical protein